MRACGTGRGVGTWRILTEPFRSSQGTPVHFDPPPRFRVRAHAPGARRGILTFPTGRAPCALGQTGIRAVKREGDGATPAGCLPFRRVHYRADRVDLPRLNLPARPIGPEDGWCDDPASPFYNRPVRLPAQVRHERMQRDDHLYDVVVELGYNDDPPLIGQGSAVFLHLAREGLLPTEGCVAVPRAVMMRLLPTIRPGDALYVEL
jgi:L,D-peptidoglycan transpeptidase YkuD (ErfK/YbiS/YcfS/YnhG family)